MNRKLNVLHVSSAISPGGGPPGYVHNLMTAYNSLLENKYEVNLRFWAPEVNSERINAFPYSHNALLRLLPVKAAEFVKIKAMQYKLRRITANNELLKNIHLNDVIVFHDNSFINIFPLLKRMQKKVVYMQHSPAPWTEEVLIIYSAFWGVDSSKLKSFRKYLIKIEQYAFSEADNIIVPAPHAIDGYSDVFPNLMDSIRHKILYILSGAPSKVINSDIVQQKKKHYSIPANKKIIAYAGRYHTHKGFDVFLDIVNKSASLFPGLYFISMGAGNIDVPGKLPNYTNIGWTPDVYEIMSFADCLICPNKVTYFDLLPLEAMSLGKVVIASPVGGNLDLNEYSEGVLLPENDDVNGYLEILDKISRNKIDVDLLGAENQKQYKGIFTLEKFVNRHLDAFRKSFFIQKEIDT